MVKRLDQILDKVHQLCTCHGKHSTFPSDHKVSCDYHTWITERLEEFIMHLYTEDKKGNKNG